MTVTTVRLPGFRGNLEDFLIFENVSCTRADGEVYEHYDRIPVALDVDGGGDGRRGLVRSYLPYTAIADLENENSFLPSLALTFNILDQAYKKKKDPRMRHLLMQYNNNGGYYHGQCGAHIQNTLISFKQREIIHYPYNTDFPSYGGDQPINTSRQQQRIPFTMEDWGLSEFWGTIPLRKAVQRESLAHFLKNVTGLQDLSLLMKLGKYLGHETILVAHENNNTTVPALFGFYHGSFGLLLERELEFNLRANPSPYLECTAARRVRVRV